MISNIVAIAILILVIALGVRGSINSIDGASCKVNLRKGRVDIEFDREIDDSVFIKAIEDLDFHVIKPANAQF